MAQQINIGPESTQIQINILSDDGLIDYTIVLDHGHPTDSTLGRRTIISMDHIGSRSGATANHENLIIN